MLTGRRAALVGVLFLVFAAFYYLFAFVVEPVHVDFAGITMLVALAAAMGIMAYVLVAGSQHR